MANIDREYHKLCREILREGYTYMDESRGIMCKQISSYTLEINSVYTHFPLLTTKKMFTKGIVGELIWFLRGDSNIKYLNENNIRIWNKDAYNWFLKSQPELNVSRGPVLLERIPFEKDNENHMKLFLREVLQGKNNVGDVGRNYGVQWKEWTMFQENIELHDSNYPDTFERNSFDQIANLIKNLLVKPMSRRHIVTAWNPAELDQTALPPCHWAFEIIPYPIADEYKHLLPGYEYFFDLKWHQRSVDTFLGLPFNIASYALLMKIIHKLTNMIPGTLIGDLSNVHFYSPHIKAVEKQLSRNTYEFIEPKFRFSDKAEHYFEAFRNSTHQDNSNFDFVMNQLEISDFIFENYEFYPAIEAEMYEPKK